MLSKSFIARRSNFFSLHTTLFSFLIFLILGNLPRIVKTQSLFNNISISEFLIYFLSLANIFYLKEILLQKIKLLILFTFLLLSNLYGNLLHGVDLQASLYALRLILIIASGYVFGIALFKKFNNDLLRTLHFYLMIYAIVLAISLIQLFLFPQTTLLMSLLNSMGIQLIYDPHSGRLISPYLDPNFFAVISCIPWLCSHLLRSLTKKRIYLFFSYLFFLSVILTWSRNGIATIFLLIFFTNHEKIFAKRILLKYLPIHILFASLITLTLCFYFDECLFFLNRIWDWTEDSSAQARIDSFAFGWELVKKYPLFGMGYNHLIQAIRSYSGLSALDSSILTTIVNFGLIPTLGIVSYFIFWSIKNLSNYKKIKHTNPILYEVHSKFYIYLLIVIVFSSQFINCLYYPFWLIPVISLFTYFNLCRMNL